MRSNSGVGFVKRFIYYLASIALMFVVFAPALNVVHAATTRISISSCSDLETIRDDLDASYILTQDIDCYSTARIPIGGHAEPFTGTFNGAGNTIRTYIGTGVTSYAGLFGSINGAFIHNLNLEGLVIANGSNVGGLAGEATGNSKVVFVTSSMEIQATGDNVGGLIGYLESNATGYFRYNSSSGDVSGDQNVGGLYGRSSYTEVEKSYATGDVDATENAGGLIGYSSHYGASQTYASGSVTTTMQRAGGLIGLQEEGTVTDSYATGYVSSTGPGFYVGGLIGAINSTHVSRSYATGSVSGNLAVGGLIGYSVNESYVYDVFSIGFPAGAGATVNSLIGQDFSDILIASNAFTNADNEKFCMVNASEAEVDNCTQISIADFPNTFFASDDEPFRTPDEQVWDFENIWQTSGTSYPTLRSSALVSAEIAQDLNGDLIPDSEQPNIGGYTSGYTGKTVAIDVGESCELTTDDMTSENSFPVQDSNYEYANGLWEWEAECGSSTTTIKLYYYNVSSAGLTVRKFSTITNTYFTLDDATFEEVTINGQPVTVVTYQITDNSVRDMNLDVGMINDPVGIATSVNVGHGSLANTGSDQRLLWLVSLLLVFAPVYYVFKRTAIV